MKIGSYMQRFDLIFDMFLTIKNMWLVYMIKRL